MDSTLQPHPSYSTANFDPGTADRSTISAGDPKASAAYRSLVKRARELARALKEHLATQVEPTDRLGESRFLLWAAQDATRPLSERLRILGLMAASLDNLFILELPPLHEAAQAGEKASKEQLVALAAQVQPVVDQAAAYVIQNLLPELEAAGVQVRSAQQLLWEERSWIRGYFQSRVYPLLTPLAVDPGRPFPFISTHSLNVLVQLPQDLAIRRQNPRGQHHIYARIKVPRVLPRFIPLPEPQSGPRREWMWSEELVRFSAPELFQGMEVSGAYLFRVLRSGSQLTSPATPTSAIPASRQQEKLTQVMRLDVEAAMPQPMLDWLVNHLEVPAYSVFRSRGPLNLVQLVDLANILDVKVES